MCEYRANSQISSQMLVHSLWNFTLFSTWVFVLEYNKLTFNHNHCVPGPGYIYRQNNSSSLLVQHLPRPRHQCEHTEPELSLEAGGGRAAAAPGCTSRRLGQSRREASPEHHLYISPDREFPQAESAMIAHIQFCSILLYKIQFNNNLLAPWFFVKHFWSFAGKHDVLK